MPRGLVEIGKSFGPPGTNCGRLLHRRLPGLLLDRRLLRRRLLLVRFQTERSQRVVAGFAVDFQTFLFLVLANRRFG